jgi:peptidyl-dipeptidase Dcp
MITRSFAKRIPGIAMVTIFGMLTLLPVRADVPANPDGLPATNPFAAAATTPFEAPPFDKIKESDYEPALDQGMRDRLAEIRAIATNPDPATFDNTMVALEESGKLLYATSSLFFNIVNTDGDDALNALQDKEAPLLQQNDDAVMLDPQLYARVKTIYDHRNSLNLTPAQKFLVERLNQRFVRAGANLSDSDKAKLQHINGEIATLQARYDSTIVKATDAGAVIVKNKAQLAGMSPSAIAAAASEAKMRKLAGDYLLALQNTTQQPLTESIKDRALRRRIYAASEARGDRSGPTDMRTLIATLAKKRAERAALLGSPTFADYTIEDQMAQTPTAARKLLTDLVPLATAKARSEAAEIQALIDAQHGGFKLGAADWQYYADQVRAKKYSIDQTQVRRYFVLDKVLNDGVFYAANKLYGLTFKPRPDLPLYNPDMKAYEVFDADGSSLALFYFDFFARPKKQGGAWCDVLNRPSGLDKTKPILINVENFSKPGPGQPALISFDDVTTMFHEFGHGLHAMFSKQYYPDQYGFDWPTDAIEFPSQFNEHWALDRNVLPHYAHDYQTAAPIPAALVAKIKAAAAYGSGFSTTEVLEASLLDLDWHNLPASAPLRNPDTFEAASLKKNGFTIAAIPPRYKSTYFSHIWSGGYAANYYSYTWAEILDDDAFAYIEDHGGLTRQNGQRFRDLVLGPGYTTDPMTLYRNFRGGNPTIAALELDKGFR